MSSLNRNKRPWNQNQNQRDNFHHKERSYDDTNTRSRSSDRNHNTNGYDRGRSNSRGNFSDSRSNSRFSNGRSISRNGYNTEEKLPFFKKARYIPSQSNTKDTLSHFSAWIHRHELDIAGNPFVDLNESWSDKTEAAEGVQLVGLLEILRQNIRVLEDKATTKIEKIVKRADEYHDKLVELTKWSDELKAKEEKLDKDFAAFRLKERGLTEGIKKYQAEEAAFQNRLKADTQKKEAEEKFSLAQLSQAKNRRDEAREKMYAIISSDMHCSKRIELVESSINFARTEHQYRSLERTGNSTLRAPTSISKILHLYAVVLSMLPKREADYGTVGLEVRLTMEEIVQDVIYLDMMGKEDQVSEEAIKKCRKNQDLAKKKIFALNW